MSFGWSAGDVASAVKLIYSIVSSLRNTSGAREQFRELETELFGLKRALQRIDSLTQQASPPYEIQALKFVSLYCVETLERFHEKIKPFEDSLGVQSRMSRWKAAPMMVRWQLLLKKDLPELRQYLMVHVGYLNLELGTASLKSMSRANNSIEGTRVHNDRAIKLIEQRIDNAVTTKQSVEEIRKTVERVWNHNHDLAKMVRDLLQKTTTPPSTRYTWAQEPIRFENALGNVIPVASESDWEILNAIILTQFSKGPGRKKVSAGEYELFESAGNLMVPVNATNCPRLRPGMHVTMAIIIGQYSGSQRCPRLGCSSRCLSDAGLKGVAGTLCSSCGTWVRRSNKSLPKPLRPPGMGSVVLRPSETEDISVGHETPSNLMVSDFSSSYPERIAYRNISIYTTELPPTPRVFQNRFDPKSSFITIRAKKVTSVPPALVDERVPSALSVDGSALRIKSLPLMPPLPHHTLSNQPASSLSSLNESPFRTTLKHESAQCAHVGPGPLGAVRGPASENSRTAIYSDGFLYDKQYHPHSSLTNQSHLNTPCDTVFVGNLAPDTSEEELKAIFSKQPGYRRFYFRNTQNGPICFVQFNDKSLADRAVNELHGYKMPNTTEFGICLGFSKDSLGLRSHQPFSIDRLSEPGHLGNSSPKDHLAAAVFDLLERVDDWKSLKIESFGYLLRFGTFTMVKGDRGKYTGQEYHIYLFEHILLFFRDFNPTKKMFKIVMKKNNPSVTSSGKPRLRLRGRLYFTNLTDIVCLQKPDHYRIQLFWKGNPGAVDNCLIHYTDQDTMRDWYQDIDTQRVILCDAITYVPIHEPTPSRTGCSPAFAMPLPITDDNSMHGGQGGGHPHGMTASSSFHQS